MIRSIKEKHSSLRQRHGGVMTLLGAICLHLYCGSLYIWGNIDIYIASYLRKFDPTLTVNTTFSIFPVIVITGTFLMPLGEHLARTCHPRFVILLGAGVSLSGIFASSFVTRFEVFVFSYGLCFGFGNATLYILAIVCTWTYFPRRRGLINGLDIAHFGLGSFVFNIAATWLVNPQNHSPSVEY